MNSKILFFCQEPADYLFHCITTLGRLNPSLSLVVIYKKLPFITPFLLDGYTGKNITMLEYEKVSRKDLINLIKDSVGQATIFVTGWRDKKYLPAGIFAKRKKVKVIWCFDNPWLSGFKQLLGLPFIIMLRYLSAHKAFITGNAQYTYARKLGFNHSNITTGLYVANEERFNTKNKTSRAEKRLVFVGRLVEYKWIRELLAAFLEIKKETATEWKLVIIGNGPLASEIRTSDPSVRQIEFLQPGELVAELANGGVACIPSLVENWGVVVHEFALMGFPLIASDHVHAVSQYLVNNYNGYIFQSGDYNHLKEILSKIMSLSDDQLMEMGRRSTALAGENNVTIWCEKVKSMIE